jgi:ferredoxin
MPTIKFLNEKKSVEVEKGTNLRRAAIREGVQLYQFPHNYVNCMGWGQCASCKVCIKKGIENVKPAGWWERLRWYLDPLAFFSRLGHEKEMRLACRVQVQGDIEVETRPPVNFHGEKFWG